MKKKEYIAPTTESINFYIEANLLTDPSSSFKADDKDVDFSDKSNNKVWNSHIWSSMDNPQ